jgi:hypothetical protein
MPQMFRQGRLLFVSPLPTIQWLLSSLRPQLNLPPNQCKTRCWIEGQFHCRDRGRNGCNAYQRTLVSSARHGSTQRSCRPAGLTNC